MDYTNDIPMRISHPDMIYANSLFRWYICGIAMLMLLYKSSHNDIDSFRIWLNFLFLGVWQFYFALRMNVSSLTNYSKLLIASCFAFQFLKEILFSCIQYNKYQPLSKYLIIPKISIPAMPV